MRDVAAGGSYGESIGTGSDTSSMQILGIVNLTRDSFSDGGQFIETDAAVAHARRLVADGADLVDLGAESTHPDAEDVSAEEEIVRLTPVVQALRAEGVRVSVDTYKAAVIRAMLALGVEVINDVTALRDPGAVAAVRDSTARVILMHSTASGARAERVDVDATTVMERIDAFFERRIAELEAAGIARKRLILDPGMGFFLSRDANVSAAVLANLNRLERFGLPCCVSTSRKSFLGALLGDRTVAERGAGTLASELWAVACGVEFVRTHDVRALRDAAIVWGAIEGARGESDAGESVDEEPSPGPSLEGRGIL
jgi:dihydropteroate synthase type 2